MIKINIDDNDHYIYQQLHRKVEFGCLKHPGASTIGSQFLDGDFSHSWQILAPQPWAPTQERETGTCHTE